MKVRFAGNGAVIGTLGTTGTIRTEDAGAQINPDTEQPVGDCISVEGAVSAPVENNDMTIAEAHELYQKYFKMYNQLMASGDADMEEITEVRNKMLEAKNRLKKLQ